MSRGGDGCVSARARGENGWTQYFRAYEFTKQHKISKMTNVNKFSLGRPFFISPSIRALGMNKCARFEFYLLAAL